MSRPVWLMSSNLGTVPELTFYDRPLEVSNPTAANIEFSFLSGELPPGIQVVKSGILQGVPVILDSLPVDESRLYTFTVRARTTELVVDKTFTMTVTNVFPPIIVPKVQLIDHTFDGTYFEHQLRALDNNPNARLVWTLVNGQLPPGITMSTNGLLQGYIRLQPASLEQGIKGYDAVGIDPDTNQQVKQFYDDYPYDFSGLAKNKSYTFTVQVTDGSNVDSFTYDVRVATKQLFTADQDHNALPQGASDEKVAITVDNDYLTVDHDNRYVPIITTPSQALPVIRQENNFAFKFDAIDFNDDPIEWTMQVASGAGFDQNNISINWAAASPTQHWGAGIAEPVITHFLYSANGSTTDFSFDRSPWSDLITFEVQSVLRYRIDDQGLEEILEQYQIGVDYTVGSSGTAISFISAPTGKIKMTVLVKLPVSPEIPVSPLEGSFDNGLFDQSESKLPPDLSINADGWMYGVVAPQAEPKKTYDFIVKAFKRDDPTYVSDPKQYSITILGDEVDIITWISPSDLGIINNGSISELKLSAYSGLGKNIIYRLKTRSAQRLPQGLKLLSDGLISGRVSFRYFSLDRGETTYDRVRTQFDNEYQFTVEAITEDGLSSSSRDFTIRVNPRHNRPYENLYFRAFPRRDQRELFNDIINNQDIFPDNLIYRASDPWFGKSQNIKFLELAGLSPSELSDYANAVATNHYWKRIDFGNVKTAVAVDEFYNVKYEVVYVEVVDPTNIDNTSVSERIDFPASYDSYLEYQHRLGFPSVGTATTAYRTIYPNSFSNLDDNMISDIGYQARGMYPDWMTSVQPDKTVLGFRRAVVLAYTVPGAAKLIAYRLKNNGIRFDQIEFVIDRYQLDNSLTEHFDIRSDQFDRSKETSFDRLILGPGELDGGVVDYAVRQTFESIHNRTVKYIKDNGGIDGIKTFEDGDLLVFAQQENYAAGGSLYDGWVDRQNLYFGDMVTDIAGDGDGTKDLEAVTRLPNTTPSGLDLEYGFDSYRVIPGFWEKQQTIKTVPLVQTANAGTSYLFVPYVIGEEDNYLNKSITAYSGIESNTIVIDQSVVDVGAVGDPELQTRLTINTEVESEITVGGTIEVSLAMLAVAAGETNRVRVNAIPVQVRKGGVLFGEGIPEGSVVRDVVGDYIYCDQDLSSVANGTVVSYRTANQRGGIWRVNFEKKEPEITMMGNVDLGTTVSYISLQNQSVNKFLADFPAGIGGEKNINNLDGKTVVFLGNHVLDRFWTNPDVFDLDVLSVDGETIGGYDYVPEQIVPEQDRTGIWRINIVTSGGQKIFYLTPEEPLDLNDRVEIIGGTQFIGKSYYVTKDRTYASYPPMASAEELVTLEFVKEIQLGQKIKVLAGKSHGFTFMIYDPVALENETVPTYHKWQDQAETVDKTTIFDGNGTRFFNSRDTYSEPGSDDKYIKFPKIGVFT